MENSRGVELHIKKRMKIIKDCAEGIYGWCKNNGVDIDRQDSHGVQMDSYLNDILLCSDLENNQPELWEDWQ